ncbi:MAG: AAA family ATPase [Anaerolineales bacterium]|nr:AAA family ATPase [Anaerolineales bacterium]
MLIEFTVGNFRSFKEPITLSMVAAKLKARDPRVNENNTIVIDEKLTLLTSAAVYGANASGKSNLVQALRFMRDFVLGSSRDTQVAEPIDVESFRLSTETTDAPSFFEAVFITKGTQYRYGFEANQERILSEWLFYVPKQREVRLFIRHEDQIECGRGFKEGRGLEERTRSNALFLSVVAQFDGPLATEVLLWFRMLGIISGLSDVGYRGYTVQKLEEENFRVAIISMLKQLDLGILDVRVEKSAEVEPLAAPVFTVSIEAPEGISESVQRKLEQVLGKSAVRPMGIYTVHTKYDANGAPVGEELFDLGVHESEGTQKLFFLTGPLIDTLNTGRVLVIDEMEARMHPLLTRAIIGMFNSQETNPKRAQLVFTTHDTNLLSNKIFRRDQIWFVDKDDFGASHLYSLAEIRLDETKVRNDASFENDYIQGRYGAIPFLGGLRRVVICNGE